MNAIRRFMIGRYGADNLSYCLLGTGFILTLISSVFNIGFINVLATLILAFVLFRTLSKNIYARNKENITFMQLTKFITAPIYRFKSRIAQKKIYSFYKCPSCKQELRVPKNKGNLKIKCPKCEAQFIRRT